MDNTNNIAGNYYDKHHSQNPIAKMLMRGFYRSFDALTDISGQKAMEIGCGEGELMMRLARAGWDVDGFDIEEDIIKIANKNLVGSQFRASAFHKSIFDIHANEFKDYDLVICCEVLEHVPNSEQAIDIVRACGAKNFVFSVPREPIWRMMNMARFKYLSDFGNTPGHINHWNQTQFLRIISRYFNIQRVKSPLPWSFVHAVAN